MTDYLKRTARFFALMALVPLVVGFISSWSAVVGFMLFILGIPAALIALAVGAVLLLVRGARLPLQNRILGERVIAVSISPVLLAVTLLVALPILRTGSFIGNISRLIVNHKHYENIIAKVQKTRAPFWLEDDNGVIYKTDLGPPIRIAFDPEGILDNWSGIIYDPTGDVMLAKGFDPATGKFFAPDRVTKLFKGDLLECRHLWRDYYDCSFT